jgi:mannitol/fructose-specific phosphotransferase system IIA component (Ntr-type)
LPPERLHNSLTPIADAAENFAGNPGYIAITIAALLAFITTANAGIMSASRYPLALSRDHLLPEYISRVHKRFKTPVISTVITGGFIMAALLLPLEILVKSASTVILTTYILSNISIFILRESRVQNYQPSFRVPFYPWLQIISTVFFVVLIIDMGYATIEISIGLVLIGLLIYGAYGRKNTPPEYALLHVLERLTNKRLTSHNLETELRDILHQRDEVIHDQFDEFIKVAPVLDLEGPLERNEFFVIIASYLAEDIRLTPGKMQNVLKIHALLKEREQESSTTLTPYVAIPHIVIEKPSHIFKILIARCHQGIYFSEICPAIKAVFVIIGTKNQRNSHLKSLAAIAQIVQNKHFEQLWLQAKNESRLRDILLLSERKRDHAQTASKKGVER